MPVRPLSHDKNGHHAYKCPKHSLIQKANYFVPWHVVLRIWALPNSFKLRSLIDLDLLYGKVKFD